MSWWTGPKEPAKPPVDRGIWGEWAEPYRCMRPILTGANTGTHCAGYIKFSSRHFTHEGRRWMRGECNNCHRKVTDWVQPSESDSS